MKKLSFWDTLTGDAATSNAVDQAADEINRAQSDIGDIKSSIRDLLRSSAASDKVLQTQARELLKLHATVQVLTEILVASGAITTEVLQERIQQRLDVLSAPPIVAAGPEGAKKPIRRGLRGRIRR